MSVSAKIVACFKPQVALCQTLVVRTKYWLEPQNLTSRVPSGTLTILWMSTFPKSANYEKARQFIPTLQRHVTSKSAKNYVLWMVAVLTAENHLWLNFQSLKHTLLWVKIYITTVQKVTGLHKLLVVFNKMYRQPSQCKGRFNMST